MTTLTDLERQIIQYLDEGYARWKIAEKVGLGETTVRRVITRLCNRYQCKMREIPQAARKEQEWLD